MRIVILNTFQNFHSKLGNSFKELLNKKSQLDIYKFEIISTLIQAKYVEEENINKFEEEYNSFREIIFDIDSYLYDLQIGLQNEFYKKLFAAKKVPKRKPTDPNIKVLVPKKSRTSFIS